MEIKTYSFLWLFLVCIIKIICAHENYALNEEDSCFSLGFHAVLHSDAGQDPATHKFVSSFSSFLSLELADNAHDAFMGYASLSPPHSSVILDEMKRVLNDGCECMLGRYGKNKKTKGSKKKVLKADPVCKSAYAFYFLADYYKRFGQNDVALELFIVATQINPSLGEAFAQAGSILLDKGQASASLHYLKRATEIYPKKYFTHYYYALALTHLNRMDDAVECFDKALAACTSAKEKFNVLVAYSLNLHKAGRKYWEKAEEIYQKTLETAQKDSPASHFTAKSHYGAFLKDKGEYERAVTVLVEAVEGNPSECGFRLNLGHAYESRHKSGDTERALEQYDSPACATQMRARCEAFVARQKLCAWDKAQNWTHDIRTISDAVRTTEPLCVTPAMAVFSELAEPSVELAISRNFAEKAEKNVKSKYKHSPKQVGSAVLQLLEKLHSRVEVDTNTIEKTARIKIGYISAYFYDHIVGYIFETLLKRHNTAKFEIFLYALNPPTEKDKTRKKIAENAEHFVDVSSLHYTEVADRINEDGILVLVNLDGHMPGFPQEILAILPAPVQIAFLGFPGSSGSNYTQYIVADKLIIPPKQEFWDLFTEKVIYMPHTYLPTQQATIHSGLSMKKSSERNAKFTFCSLNQLIKLDPATMKLWKRILAKVPNSQLWLQKHPSDAVPYLKDFAQDSDIVFLDRNSSVMEYMNQMKRCDLFLDPLKYNSHTTGADSLWMGVPLLTTPGIRFASRVGAGLLQALENPFLVDTLVTDDVASYEETAVRLATNVSLWTQVQETLTSCVRSSALFNLQKWVEDWERGLTEAGYKYAFEMSGPEHIYL